MENKEKEIKEKNVAAAAAENDKAAENVNSSEAANGAETVEVKEAANTVAVVLNKNPEVLPYSKTKKSSGAVGSKAVKQSIVSLMYYW